MVGLQENLAAYRRGVRQVPSVSLTFALHERDKGRPIGDLELLKNMVEMRANGPVPNPQILSDRAILHTIGDQSDDLVFPARELWKLPAGCFAGPIVQLFRRAQEDRL